MGRMVLIRHAESVFNRENRFAGRIDTPLTEYGRREALRVGLEWRWRKITHIFSSPLVRAYDTALWLRQPFEHVLDVRCDDRLIERDYGELAGMNRKKAEQIYGSEPVRIFRRSLNGAPPDGEALKVVHERVKAWINEIGRPLASHPAYRIIVVAHGNTIRAMIYELSKLTNKELENLEIEQLSPVVYECTEHGRFTKLQSAHAIYW